jgi:hypothetical protein
MKTIALVLAMLSASLSAAQTPAPQAEQPTTKERSVVSAPEQAPQPATAQVQTEPLELAPVAALLHPERYAVAFLPQDKGNEGIAFLVTPAGKLGTLPIRNLAAAFNAGYRPFTVADLLAITNSVADEEKNSQRRIKELSEDYDALAARYNRLAVINSTPAVHPQPAVDERQAMRAMVFQSLLQRTFPTAPVRIQVQTVDCTKFPALCVGR